MDSHVNYNLDYDITIKVEMTRGFFFLCFFQSADSIPIVGLDLPALQSFDGRVLTTQRSSARQKSSLKCMYLYICTAFQCCSFNCLLLLNK